MSRFSGNPNLLFLYWPDQRTEHLDPKYFDGEHAMLLEELTYTSQHKDGDSNNIILRAKSRLITDGGSIPELGSFLKLIGTPYRHYLPCFLIHDQMCKEARDMAELARKRDDAELMGLARGHRWRADDGMLEMLAYIHKTHPIIRCNLVKRRSMHIGVRLGALHDRLRRCRKGKSEG